MCTRARQLYLTQALTDVFFRRVRVGKGDAAAIHQVIESLRGDLLEAAIATYSGPGSWLPLNYSRRNSLWDTSTVYQHPHNVMIRAYRTVFADRRDDDIACKCPLMA